MSKALISKIKKRNKEIRPYYLAVLFALVLRWLFVEAYVIPSESMLPSLLVNDHIFVNKINYGVRIPFSKSWLLKLNSPKAGDVIVFNYPEDESVAFIKRIIAVPGDVVVYEAGVLKINHKVIAKEIPLDFKILDFINDNELPGGKSEYNFFHENISGKDYGILLKREGEHKDLAPTLVPEGHYLVFGDNRDNSKDSRYWGFVPEENIFGKAMFVWLSCDQTFELASSLCKPNRIRWDRLFTTIQ